MLELSVMRPSLLMRESINQIPKKESKKGLRSKDKDNGQDLIHQGHQSQMIDAWFKLERVLTGTLRIRTSFQGETKTGSTIEEQEKYVVLKKNAGFPETGTGSLKVVQLFQRALVL